MPIRRAVMFAPHHADSDVRVLRTVAVLTEISDRLEVFWDSEYPGHQFAPATGTASITHHYLARRRTSLGLSALGARALPKPIVDALKAADLAYIHASGIEGIVYSREVRRHNPACRVVFDYHDSLGYECFYQLERRKLAWLFGLIWPFYRRLLKRFAPALDGVVGISRNQLFELECLLERSMATVVVPNLRAFTGHLVRPAQNVTGEEVSFVWLGQVMQGRDLERIAGWLDFLGGASRLYVYGKIIDSTAAGSVKSVLGERVVFLGEYRGDLGIAGQLPANPVGLFLGWDDPCSTGINSIASPNKYFTYMNLEVPVILDARLHGLAAEITKWRAGIAVNDPSEFVRATQRMKTEYRAYAESMGLLKASYMQYAPEDELRQLLRRISVNSSAVAGARL